MNSVTLDVSSVLVSLDGHLVLLTPPKETAKQDVARLTRQLTELKLILSITLPAGWAYEVLK
jgi:hypothetical protein